MRAGDRLLPDDVKRIEWATRRAEENSGFSFTAYVAEPDLTGTVPDRAHALHAGLLDRDRAVLVYVDPQRRELQIVTGAETTRTLTDTECRLAAATMVSSFAAGDLAGGLVNGISQLGEAARGLRTDHVANELLQR